MTGILITIIRRYCLHYCSMPRIRQKLMISNDDGERH